jgi:peptide/nickel transport system substrate-binding protein
MNHVSRAQASRAGNRRLAERNWPDAIAFLLNQWAAFDANRPRDAAAQHQVVVRGIHDRVHIRVSEIALPQPDLHAPIIAHRHVIIAPTVGTRKTTASLLLFAQIAAAVVALAGCDSRRDVRAPGTIQIDIETSPTSTDPRFGTDATSSRINELIFDSLVKTDRDGQFVGHLAESIARPSPTEIIFHLKHGVRFSDGRELTARDVLFTYNSILAPQSMSPKRAGLEKLKSIDAPDDYTVVMTTARPYAPALELATEGIVPAGTPLPAKQSTAAPVGSGPFQMVDYARDEAIRLERNPYYPHPPGAAQSVLVKIVPDPTVRALELAEGVCDFSGNNIEDDVLPWIATRPFLQISKTPGTTYKYLSFNFHDPRLRDLRVRRAIAYAIDRNTIVNTMLRGTGRIATGMLSPENWAYDGNVTGYTYDPQKSRQLLDQAGYPAGSNGMRGLRFDYKTTPEGARLGEVFQAMLQQVGIELTIRTLDFATYYADIQAGNFDLTSLQWVGINDPNSYYMIFDSNKTPPHGENRGYYSNSALDKLLEAGMSTVDPDARKKIYAQVQQLAADDLPYVSLWWVDNVAVMNRRLVGFDAYPNGSFRSLATVTLVDPGSGEPSQ